MATENQDVQVNYKVTGAEDATKKTSLFSDALGKIGSILRTGVIAAVGAFVAAIGLGIKEITESEKVTAKLNQALLNTGKYSKETSKALTEYASAMQKKIAFDDESIIAAEAAFAQYGLEQKQIEELTAATADLAQAKGMDLASAAELVARSVGTSTNALARQGVALDGAAGSSQRVSAALAGLNQVFGGQAEAFGKTFPGQLAIFKNEVMDVAGKITQYLMPAFTAGIGIANKLLNAFGSFVDSAGVKEFIGELGQSFNRALTFIKPFWDSFVAWAKNIYPTVKETFTNILKLFNDIFGILNDLGVGGVVKFVFDTFLKGAEAVLKIINALVKGITWVADSLKKMTGKKVSVEQETTTSTSGGTTDTVAALQAEEERKTEILNEQNRIRNENKLAADAAFKELTRAIKDEENTAEQDEILLADEEYRARQIAELEFFAENEQQKIALKTMTNAQLAALEVAKDAKLKAASTDYVNFVAAAGEKEKDIGRAVAAGTLEFVKDSLKKQVLAKSAEIVQTGFAILAASLGTDLRGYASVLAGGALAAAGTQAIDSIQLAEGGSMIVDSPTRIGGNVIAGEAGAERIDVTPLSNGQGGQTINNNIYIDGELITKQVFKTGDAMQKEGTLG